MFRNNIKTAMRSLLKNKGFTIINIAGLALGLTTFLLILFYVMDELSYDRFNTKADRIYRVNADIKYGGSVASYAVTPPPLATALTGNFPEVERSARLLAAGDIRFKKGAEILQENKTVYADEGIFDIFSLSMIQGNPANALSEPNCIVLTEKAAKKYFGRTDVVGQNLYLFTFKTNYKITGVIHNIPVQSHFNFDYFLSMPSLAASREIIWNNFSVSTYILCKPGTDYKKLAPRISALFRKFVGEENYAKLEQTGNYIRLDLTPLTAIHLQSNRQYELGANNNSENIYIFSAIALFVLLIACINFMNLSTARSANRAREIGVRKVLGSSRGRLVAQFLSESVLITCFAAIIAALAAWALLPFFNEVADKELSVTAHSIGWLSLILAAIVLIVSLLAGSYPAFFLSGFQPIHVLKGRRSAGGKDSHFRNSLVVFQFSISIFLMIGTLVIYNQLHYIQQKDLGFDRSHVLVVKNVNELEDAKTFAQQIRQFPEVMNASLSSFLPTGSLRAPNAVFTSRTADTKSALFTEIWPVDEEYLPAMGIRLVKGRNFSDRLLSDSLGILINETAARMLGYAGDPLDRKLFIPSEDTAKPIKEYRVIGLVKDFNFNSLRDNITPVVMIVSASNGALSIRTNTGGLSAFIAKVQDKWNALSPNQHFEYSFMDEDFNAAYRSERRSGKLFLSFTILALIIACLGLFSLAAYAAEQRKKEIGIRKVLGASVSALVGMLSKDFLKLVCLAILISSPVAWFLMQKWLQDFAYRVDIHGWVLATAGLAAVLIAFITVSYQSIKAANVNPVESLRSE